MPDEKYYCSEHGDQMFVPAGWAGQNTEKDSVSLCLKESNGLFVRMERREKTHDRNSCNRHSGQTLRQLSSGVCGYVLSGKLWIYQGSDPDGEEQDAYVIGVEKAVKEFTGRIIAVVHRFNDVEEKWVVAPEGFSLCAEEIMEQIWFQEKYFKSEIRMEMRCGSHDGGKKIAEQENKEDHQW